MESTELNTMVNYNEEPTEETRANEEEPCILKTGAKENNVEDKKNSENANTYTVNNKKKPWSVSFRPPPKSEFEKWCSNKTGLSRYGLLIAAIFILIFAALLIAVLVMAFLWPVIPHSLMFPICRSPACLLASSEILAKMNKTIIPCEDIREYACGHWLSSHSIPKDSSVWSIKHQMRRKHRENLRNIITTMPYPEEVETLQWRIKNIYDSCMSLGTVETEKDRPLTKIISKLGGWHVLKNFAVYKWDMKKTLRELHSQYNIQPFFQIEVVPDPKQPMQTVIQISPGSLGMPDRSYYYRKSDDKDIVRSLGATSDAASIFSDDIFGFEKRLAERFPWKMPERMAHYRPSIAKLEIIAPSVPFYDILNTMFPQQRLTKKTEVVVIASDHLVNVSHILSNTDKSALNDFMILKLAVGYLSYLHKPVRNIIKEFNQQLYGIQEQQPRWEFCVETLQKFAGFGLEAMLENSEKVKTEGERKKKVVTDLFEDIRSTVKAEIVKSNNLPSHIQEHFLDKINTIKIQVGLDEHIKRPDHYNGHYSYLNSAKDDFFENVINSMNFVMEEQRKKLLNPSNEHMWVDVVSNGKLNVAYVVESNQVVVPLALLSMPYFHPHYPSSVLYGGIGAEIAIAILSSISGPGLFHAGDGAILPQDHPLHERTHECFVHHPGATLHLEAVRFTYLALEKVMMKNPHIHQPGIEYLEDPAIFFISYAQSLCTMKTPQREDLDTTTSKQTLNDFYLLDLIMSKSKQFSKTFNCKKQLRKESCDVLI